MSSVDVPLPPSPAWWEPAGICTVTPDAAGAAHERLERLTSHTYFIGRLSVPAIVDPSAVADFTDARVAQRILPNLRLDELNDPDVRVSKYVSLCGHANEHRRRTDDSSQNPTLLFPCVTACSVGEASEKIIEHCKGNLAEYWNRSAGDPEAWRCLQAFRSRDPDSKRKVVSGEPLSLDVIYGPLPQVPEELEGELPFDSPFVAGLRVSLELTARSKDTQALVELLEFGYGDVGVRTAQGTTALHLAALSGDAALAAAVAARAGPGPRAWRDADGRTPLHCAALFDSAELVQALLGACDARVHDRWGRTALDVAMDLGHTSAAAALGSGPSTLVELCSRKVRKQLRDAADAEAIQATVPLFQNHELHDVVPLHEYRALSNLAAAAPKVVDPSTALRSMSCLECWYADACGRKCSAALPDHMELIRVWDDLPSFQTPPAGTAKPVAAVLAEASGSGRERTVADRATFLERFHRRTGGIFESLDWSNLLVIGGMVLACLTADDEDYARDFRETDVDIYVVGAGFSNTGTDEEDEDEDEDGDADDGSNRLRRRPREDFSGRVEALMASLPDSQEAQEFNVYLYWRELEQQDGDPGVAFEPDHERGRLIVTEVTGALAADGRVSRGDYIVEVDSVGDSAEAMAAELAKRQKKPIHPWQHGGGQEAFCTRQLRVRRARADGMALSANVVRTPQTLTACVRRGSGEALPNVQVVLAPYASPAHLLFTTDIDCTAMGFDGQHLYATPRAREAIRHRRNIARPEKYMVRGEWRTEARLLKYANRGFSVVDLGLRPEAAVQPHEEVSAAAREAERMLGKGAAAARSPRGDLEGCIRRVRDSGVHGACLLLLAAKEEGLRRLLLHEAPLLPAGMGRGDLIDLVYSRCSGSRRGMESGGSRRSAVVEYNDGYGKATSELVMVNPAKPGKERVEDRELRGCEASLSEAIVELNLEADRFEVRGWYDGIQPEHLRGEHASLDPSVWKGVGDFRSAA